MPEITVRLSTALADRYRIERRLGAGGMATVYLAEDLKHHRQVAVKWPSPHDGPGEPQSSGTNPVNTDARYDNS